MGLIRHATRFGVISPVGGPGSPQAYDEPHEFDLSVADIQGLADALAAISAAKANVLHQHAAGEVTSGVFDIARIPDLPVAKLSDASANGRALISAANYAAMKTLLTLTAADITNASANGRSLITAADYAAMRTLLGVTADVVVTRAYAELTASLGIAGTIPLDNTIPQIGEGTFVMSVPIVVKSATNLLRIRFKGFGGSNAGAVTVTVAAFVGGAANAVDASAASTGAANFFTPVDLQTEVVAGTTGSVTVEIRAGGSGFAFGGIGGVGGRLGTAGKTTLVVEEIVP